ncbi:MAG: metallophosphoesterase [Chloroflexi bacterium]|nr:metallophosphoesterase [Chloroflexota bacterium]
MKILALSDEVVDHIYSPQIKVNYADVDLVLGCGDLPFFYLEYVVTMLNAPLYFVPGNHDRAAQYMSDGRIIHHAEGCISADRRAFRFGDILIAGLGGSVRYRPDGEHMYTETEMAARAASLVPQLVINRIRRGRYLDILIAHSPPRDIHDGQDAAHTGFQTFRQFMSAFRPRLLLHGHAHVYRRDLATETLFAATRVINVYPYRVIEFEPSGHAH